MKAISIEKFGKFEIPIQSDDGYFHATSMCKAVGKQMVQYRNLDSAKAYLKALSSKVEYSTLELIKTKRGGWDNQKRGTWIHPMIAIHLAQWLSPEFAVFVTELVFNWQNGNIEPPKQNKIENKQPKQVLNCEILTADELQSLQQEIAIALENSWPASGVVRTVNDYCHALAARFGVFNYSQILRTDFEIAKLYVQGLTGVKPFESRDIILRCYNGRQDLTDIEKFEQTLGSLVGQAMNMVRERPYKQMI